MIGVIINPCWDLSYSMFINLPPPCLSMNHRFDDELDALSSMWDTYSREQTDYNNRICVYMQIVLMIIFGGREIFLILFDWH